MKAPVGLAAALIVLACNSVSAVDDPAVLDTTQLQYDFANATNLLVEPDWHDLPEDARRLLEHVGHDYLGGKSGLANVGEDWSDTDFIRPDVPTKMHLFSAYSDKVFGSVFVTGGPNAKAFVLVAYRHAQEFCVFKMRALFHLTTVRVSEIQNFVRPNRDTTIEPIPPCQPQSLRYPLNLVNP